MTVNGEQIRVLRSAMAECGIVRQAARVAGISEWTARRKLRDLAIPDAPPSPPRARLDPALPHETEAFELFEKNRRVTGRAVLEHLKRTYPGLYNDGHMTTIQRRLRHWRSLYGVKLPRMPKRKLPPPAKVVLDIYDALKAGERPVDELAERVGLPTIDMPRYVKMLEKAGRKVARRREGNRSYLRLLPPT